MIDAGSADAGADADAGSADAGSADAGPHHARSAVEHLQLAATEMISAAHAALDALEEFVSEPLDLGVVMTWAARLAQMMAERAWRGAVPTAGQPPATGASAGPDDKNPPVEHIPVS
jgi:hypothetical protein